MAWYLGVSRNPLNIQKHARFCPTAAARTAGSNTVCRHLLHRICAVVEGQLGLLVAVCKQTRVFRNERYTDACIFAVFGCLAERGVGV